MTKKSASRENSPTTPKDVLRAALSRLDKSTLIDFVFEKTSLLWTYDLEGLALDLRVFTTWRRYEAASKAFQVATDAARSEPATCPTASDRIRWFERQAEWERANAEVERTQKQWRAAQRALDAWFERRERERSSK